MKAPIPTHAPGCAVDHGEHEPNLLQWLTDPRGRKFFGRAFEIKSSVLVHVLTGEGSLAEIAATHGVSRQAVHWHAVKARKIYVKLTLTTL